MAVPPGTTGMTQVIGIVGLTPALAEALDPPLRAVGFVLGPTPDDGWVVSVADEGPHIAAPAAYVVLGGAAALAGTLPEHLPLVALAPPFVPERLLAAVMRAWHEAEARRLAGHWFARVAALVQRAEALCADLDREPREVAAGLVALLREEGGYGDPSVAIGGVDPADDLTDDAARVRVPIVAEGAAGGQIAATPPLGAGDPADHRRLLETLAAFVGTYLAWRIERERVAVLRAEDLRRVQELAAVNEVALATASLDLDQMLAGFLPRARTLLGADFCILVLRDPDGDTLMIRAADGPDAERVVGLTLSEGWSFSRQIIEARATQRWRPGDAAAELMAAAAHPGTRPHDAIGAPLLVQGRAIGAIVVANARPARFSEADLRFLATVAAQAAIAVENARLYADTLRLARYDALTGLANRRYFLEHLTLAVETAARYDRPLALLIIDLDHFKSINDTFGHLAGDRLLRSAAERLRARLRRSDFPARYAGDELAVILPEATLPGALALAERLRTSVAETPLQAGEAVPVWLTLSIGVAVYLPGASVTDLLRAADGALYFAKHAGRNRVCGPDAARMALTRSADDLATILRGGNQVVIEELAAAVDARVPQTAGRSALVAAVAIALGEALGLATDDLDTLRGAALVHDLGEVAIAPEILGRPGPLGAEDLALVRAHPRRGYDLLAAVPALQGALPLILHHHERWDGGGYPAGLAGEAIPLGARIIAVADAWVALTSVRPHRAARSPGEALVEIARGAGMQFDPAVVDILPQVVGREPRAGWRRG